MSANHSHEHAQPEFNRAFLIAIIANSLFVGCQLVFAHLANSTSLLADAVHNLGDVLSLVLAWVAQRLAKRPPTARSTYGMKKTSILAAFANGILLVFTCGIIVTEAVYKFLTPTAVEAFPVMVVASIGIIVNGATALLFLKGTHDLNIRAAFLHLLYDALVSVGVVGAGALLYWKGWLWVDPLVGLLIALVILKGTWALFTDSFRLIIDGVPRGIMIASVRDLLSQQQGVKGVHDLHVWALSTKENALSVHLWMPDASLDDEVRERITQKLREDHGIHHVTIQVEKTDRHCGDTCTPYL
jgi:cobalt-zinc-cadmium efflux system protein